MKRVASLYLPSWSIDRLRMIERRRAPSAETDGRAAPSTPLRADFEALGAEAAAERVQHCSVPKEGGWRPGARWARGASSESGSGLADTREQVEAVIEAMPVHRRPPQRELGRTSEAAENPFRTGPARPAEERLPAPAPLRELSRRTEAAQSQFRPGTRGWHCADPQAAVDALAKYQQPSLQELSCKSEVAGNPFRPMPPDELGSAARFTTMPSLQSPGEDASAKAGRDAALREDAKRNRYRSDGSHGSLSIQRAAATPPANGPGEDVVVRRSMRARNTKRSASDGRGGEAGYIAPPNVAQSLKQLAAMPAVQFPGEGPHPDNHGRSEPTAPTYGQGRYFQTGRTLASVVARVCREEDEPGSSALPPPDEPPLVMTRKVGSRVELAAVNLTARALGLAPGLALTMARAQVPDLEVREADPDGDAADLHALAIRLARRWSPTVTISDPDGLFIDLTGVAHLHNGEARFCRRLVRLLARHGVAARIAIADTTGAAWALARFGSAAPIQILGPCAQANALAALPVAALRLEQSALELLARLGVDAIGQLMAMPRAPLVRRFGTAIVLRLDQALGQAPEPLDPVVPPIIVEVERRFIEPIATAEAIEHWLRELMPDLATELARAGLGARAVELVAARVDGVPQRLFLGFARPTRDPTHMLRLARRRIEEIEPGCGIDSIALRVRRADPLGAESLAPVLADEAKPDLAPLVDALANRIGADRLWRAVPVQSDVPERSCTVAPPLEAAIQPDRPPRLDDVSRLDARAPDHAWHPRWPRPVRLLRHPERVDHVMAELPDQPPRRFTWRGVLHRVIRAEGPERIAGEWWRRTAERQAIRDYFRVEDEQGQRFWLYRRGDGVRGETGDLAWFLHGLGD